MQVQQPGIVPTPGRRNKTQTASEAPTRGVGLRGHPSMRQAGVWPDTFARQIHETARHSARGLSSKFRGFSHTMNGSQS